MRILVVDDSSPHRRLLTALFGRAGHEVLTAGDGTVALEILER
jgi:CheY-like chemotaxis protein